MSKYIIKKLILSLFNFIILSALGVAIWIRSNKAESAFVIIGFYVIFALAAYNGALVGYRVFIAPLIFSAVLFYAYSTTRIVREIFSSSELRTDLQMHNFQACKWSKKIHGR